MMKCQEEETNGCAFVHLKALSSIVVESWMLLLDTTRCLRRYHIVTLTLLLSNIFLLHDTTLKCL